MNLVEKQLKKAFESFEIVEIQNSVNFWMIRTQSGFFYNEFINEKFVALGWNLIDSETQFTFEQTELLKEKIKYIYGNKRPADGINKSKRFIHEVKEGDYVLIPSMGSSEIAICKVGKYYEADFDYRNELSEVKRIKNKESIIGEIRCPYKKRRHIEVLQIVSNSRLGYKLLKAISSYHGISRMNEYATDILNCVYDCYIYDDDMYMPINVAKREPITAKELSCLMYGVTLLLGELAVDDNCIFATANINSPGKYVPFLENAYRNLKKGTLKLIGFSVLLFGGEFAGHKLNGIIPGMIETVNEIQTREITIEKREEELRAYKLDNCLKALEIAKESNELGADINTDTLMASINAILSIDGSLKLVTNSEFSIGNEGEVPAVLTTVNGQLEDDELEDDNE